MRKLLAILSILTALALPSSAMAASLSLSPASGSFGQNCPLKVDVIIDTEGVETDGADIILQYNSQALTASSITNGTIYSDFPGNTIDNSTGKVSIYALAPSTKGFTGKGTVASVNFTVNASAAASLATIKFDFDQNNPSKTTDSNVIQRLDLKEILTSVSNGGYNIDPSTAGCKAGSAKTAAEGGIGGPTDTLPESGTTEVTLTLFGLALWLMLSGLFGLKKIHANL